MSKARAPIPATPENMRTHGGRGVFAFDRYSKERYSADAGDYFWQPETTPLRGMFGKPLILARQVSYVEAVQ